MKKPVALALLSSLLCSGFVHGQGFEVLVVRTNRVVVRGELVVHVNDAFVKYRDGNNEPRVDMKDVLSIHLGNGDNGRDTIYTKSARLDQVRLLHPGSFTIKTDANNVLQYLPYTDISSIHFLPPTQAKPPAMPNAKVDMNVDVRLDVKELLAGPVKPPASDKKSVAMYHPNGVTFNFINNFGHKPYISQQRYLHVVPGMELTLESDGKWNLHYGVVAVGGAAKVAWDLQLQTSKGKTIQLRTMAKYVGKIGDKEATVPRMHHWGYQPAIKDLFGDLQHIKDGGRGIAFHREAHVSFVEGDLVERPRNQDGDVSKDGD